MKKIIILFFVVFVTVVLSCEKKYDCPEPLHCNICFIENDSCVIELNEINIYKGSVITVYKDSTLTIEKYIEVSDISIVFDLDNDYTTKRNGKTMYCSDYYLKVENSIHSIHAEYSGTNCDKRFEKIVCDKMDVTEYVTEHGTIRIIVD